MNLVGLLFGLSYHRAAITTAEAIIGLTQLANLFHSTLPPISTIILLVVAQVVLNAFVERSLGSRLLFEAVRLFSLFGRVVTTNATF